MPARIVIAPGTVFGRLTAIEESRDASGNRAMLCQCECGKQKVVSTNSLRRGLTRSCGCLRTGVPPGDLVGLNPGEVPLYGKNARGRVALVDPEDFALVMQYRWFAFETRSNGVYARTQPRGGKGIFMHALIMGMPDVDHADRDGLNNVKSNLREATRAQQAANRGKRSDGQSSAYKGVHRRGGKWRAAISADGKARRLGNYASELSAAYAYDRAARELFGEFACTNFDAEPPQAVLDAWQAEAEAQQAIDAAVVQGHAEALSEWWKEQEPVTRACTVCGKEYQSRARRSFYCSLRCRNQKYYGRGREQQQDEGTLF